MPATSTVSASGSQIVNGLLSGIKWAVSNLTFSFPLTGAFYDGYSLGEEPTNGFEALNGTQQAAVRSILGSYASVANISFAEITETIVQHADLRLAETSGTPTAHAYYPSTAAKGGDTWYNHFDYNTPMAGNYAYATFLHELGHALGLKHGHEASFGFPALPSNFDSMEYSVMTYRSYAGDPLVGGYSNEVWGFAQSLMMADIAALQYMYGASFNTNSGDTTYKWTPGSGATLINGVAAVSPGGNRIFLTVWDGGGNDTYDLSSYTANLRIDLRPGEHSTFSTSQLAYLGDGNYARANVFNALQYQGDPRSLIENAIGGSGNDSIIGNAAANALYGSAGNDALFGLSGSDLLTGGAGADTFFFDSTAVADAQGGPPVFDRIVDYNRGNSGVYNPGEGDRIDLSAILASAFNGGQPVSALARAVLDPTGAFALLQVDTNGAAGGENWLTIARLDGVGAGNAVRIVPSASAPAGVDIIVASLLANSRNDFDGDGHSDIIWRNGSSGAAELWEMNGFQVKAAQVIATASAAWKIAGIDDFDGDGRSDLIWRNSASGVVEMWKMNGFQILGGQVIFNAGAAWGIAGTGDFDNDGRDDLIWRNSSSGVVEMWKMNGFQILGGQVIFNAGAAWAMVGTGDFDGDGRSDLLWRHTTLGYTELWKMNGYEIVGGQVIAAPSAAWEVAGTGDFNGDGRSDILWRNSSTGVVEMWQMNGYQILGGEVIANRGTAWEVAGTGDYDGDGRSDILWRNTSTGAAEIWKMNGYETIDSQVIATPSTVWDIANPPYELV